jgi:hypothetical protein
MSDQLACLWCGRAFSPHRGGSQQRFCRAACRAAYHKAARQWCERAIVDGRLTVEDLRNSLPAACTLPERGGAALRLANIEGGDFLLPDAPLRCLFQVERITVDWLVTLAFIRPDQSDDVAAIIAALQRNGWAPNISRVA